VLLKIAIVTKIHHAALLELADIIGIHTSILPTVYHIVGGFQKLAKAMIPKRPFLLRRNTHET
jgi:hypothetical protein